MVRQPDGGDEDSVLHSGSGWDALPVGVLLLDDDRTVVRANPAAALLLATPGSSIIGMPFASLVDPVDAAVVTECLVEVGDSGVPRTLQVPAGTTGRDLRLHVVRTGESDLLVTVDDIAELAANDRVVHAMRSVLDHWPGLVGIADDRANIVYLNDRGREMLGHAGAELADLRTTDLFGAEMFTRYYDEIRPVLLNGSTWSGVVPLVSGPGTTASFQVVLTGGVGPTGDTIEWLLAVTGTEHESTTPRDLAFRANHDHLTGLANRALFLDRLRLALLRRDRARHPVTVAFVDLDGFKAVNDAEGHLVGDDLLRLVGERIADLLRPADTVARWGGDEFVVLCENTPDGVPLEARLVAAIRSEPFRLGDRTLSLSATVGTATSPPGPSGAEELVGAADAAMYRAKRGS